MEKRSRGRGRCCCAASRRPCRRTCASASASGCRAVVADQGGRRRFQPRLDPLVVRPSGDGRAVDLGQAAQRDAGHPAGGIGLAQRPSKAAPKRARAPGADAASRTRVTATTSIERGSRSGHSPSSDSRPPRTCELRLAGVVVGAFGPPQRRQAGRRLGGVHVGDRRHQREAERLRERGAEALRRAARGRRRRLPARRRSVPAEGDALGREDPLQRGRDLQPVHALDPFLHAVVDAALGEHEQRPPAACPAARRRGGRRAGSSVRRGRTGRAGAAMSAASRGRGAADAGAGLGIVEAIAGAGAAATPPKARGRVPAQRGLDLAAHLVPGVVPVGPAVHGPEAEPRFGRPLTIWPCGRHCTSSRRSTCAPSTTSKSPSSTVVQRDADDARLPALVLERACGAVLAACRNRNWGTRCSSGRRTRRRPRPRRGCSAPTRRRPRSASWSTQNPRLPRWIERVEAHRAQPLHAFPRLGVVGVAIRQEDGAPRRRLGLDPGHAGKSSVAVRSKRVRRRRARGTRDRVSTLCDMPAHSGFVLTTGGCGRRRGLSAPRPGTGSPDACSVLQPRVVGPLRRLPRLPQRADALGLQQRQHLQEDFAR